MAKIVNLNSMMLEEVDDNNVNELIQSGEYGFLNNESIPVLETNSGDIGTLPANDAINEIRSGNYSYIGQREQTRRKLEDKYGSFTQKSIGVAEQAASGLTLGASEVAEDLILDNKEDIEGRRDVLGGIGVAANVAGTMLPLTKFGQGFKLIKGLGAGNTAIDKMGLGASSAVRALINPKSKNTVLRKAAELGVRGGVEGAMFGSADYLKEAGLGNVDLNAEAAVNSALSGAKTGALALGALGATGSAISTAAKRIKLKNKISKDLKKSFGVDETEGGFRLNTKGKDLKKLDHNSQVGSKASQFSFDQETGLYKYSDSVRDAYLDPQGIKGKILTISDIDELEKIGGRLGIEDLPKKMESFDPEKIGFNDYLINLKNQSIFDTADITLGNARIIEDKNELSQQLRKLSKGWSRNNNRLNELKKMKKTPLVVKKTAELTKKVNKLRKDYILIRDKKKGLVKKDLPQGNVRKSPSIVRNVLKEYNAIKIGKKIFIKNADSIDDAIIHASTAKSIKGKPKKLSFSDSKTLTLSGAMKSTFKKKNVDQLAELASFIRRNFRSKVNERLINHPAFTDLDDLVVNVGNSKTRSIEEMDSAINRMESVLDENGLSTSITGSKIAKRIMDDVYPQFFNKARGKALPNLEASAQAVEDFAENIRNYGKSQNGVDIPFSPRELRELRQKMDKFPGLDFDKNQSLSKELVKTARNEMENSLVKEMGKFDMADDIVNRNKAAKKEYGLAADAEVILQDRFASESKNNSISLTGYIAAGAGAGAAGIPGAVGAMALRELSRSYGNNFMALYAESIVTTTEKLGATITKSVKGFIESDTLMITPAIRAVTKDSIEKEYDEDIKSIDAGKYDIQKFADEFLEENQGLMATAPMTADAAQAIVIRSYSMLMEKLPNNPYEGSYLREYRPPDSEVRKFRRYKKALLDPSQIFREIETGMVSNESIEVLKRIYPKSYEVMQFEMMEQVSSGKKINYKKRNQINKLFGIMTDGYQRPDNVKILQAVIRYEREAGSETGQKEKPIKSSGKSGKSSDNRTTGQRLMER